MYTFKAQHSFPTLSQLLILKANQIISQPQPKMHDRDWNPSLLLTRGLGCLWQSCKRSSWKALWIWSFPAWPQRMHVCSQPSHSSRALLISCHMTKGQIIPRCLRWQIRPGLVSIPEKAFALLLVHSLCRSVKCKCTDHIKVFIQCIHFLKCLCDYHRKEFKHISKTSFLQT